MNRIGMSVVIGEEIGTLQKSSQVLDAVPNLPCPPGPSTRDTTCGCPGGKSTSSPLSPSFVFFQQRFVVMCVSSKGRAFRYVL